MTDLLGRIGSARDHVRPEAELDLRALDGQWRRLKARQRRVRTGQILAAAAILFVTIGSIPFLVSGPGPIAEAPVPPEPAPAPADDEASLRFADGSEVYFLAEGTDVVPSDVSDGAISLTMGEGAARFIVTPGLPREFRVAVGDALVTVVGTRFVIRRTSPERIDVEVEEGRVRVRSPGPDGYVEALLGPGELLQTACVAPPAEEVEPAPEAPEAPVARARAPRVSTWRALAEEGQFDEAYAALLREDDLRNEDVGDLLLAADAARLSGHREQALKFLREVVHHREDPRTSLGAFTLGRMLLRERPHEAAEAFGVARELAPTSSLAPDALAREVEAWYLAGRPERAQQLALEYVRRWPDGLRVDAVRRLGGLD